MELIILIVVISFIVKAVKKSNEEQSKFGQKQQVTYQMPKQVTRANSARVQVQQQNNQWQQAARENIAKAKQRAKANADEDKVNITLETMEAEHNHSERVSAAVHHHPEDIIPENMLGSIEDLMIKGYDGNLCFERDFVGEAMDMINRFTVPSEVPDFSKDDVA